MAKDHQVRQLLFCTCCILLLAVITIVCLILVYVVFKIEEPTTELISANVTGTAPPNNFPALAGYQLNLTIHLTFLIRNPNRVSFSHSDVGHTSLYYQDINVGNGNVEPGRVPAKGTELLFLKIKVDPDQLKNDMQKLLADTLSGAVDLDIETTMSGKVIIMGFIKLNGEVTKKCHVVIGFPEFTVRKSGCTTKSNIGSP